MRTVLSEKKIFTITFNYSIYTNFELDLNAWYINIIVYFNQYVFEVFRSVIKIIVVCRFNVESNYIFNGILTWKVDLKVLGFQLNICWSETIFFILFSIFLIVLFKIMTVGCLS